MTEQQQIYLTLAGITTADIINTQYIKSLAIRNALMEMDYTFNTSPRELMDSEDEQWQDIAEIARTTLKVAMRNQDLIEHITREDIITLGLGIHYDIDELVELWDGSNLTEEEKLQYWQENLV